MGLGPGPTAGGRRIPTAGGPGIAVVGASGGAGASTLVAALGLAGGRSGCSCVAVDLQPGGGGLDVVFGIEHVPGLRWSDLVAVEGAVDGAALGLRLPSVCGVAVLAHPRDGRAGPGAEVVVAVVRALASAFDLVVLDAARSAVALLGELCPALGTVVVLGRVGVSELAAVAAIATSLTSVDPTAGNGPPMVLLRGPSPGASSWRRLAPRRRRLCAGVAVDLGVPEVGWVGEDSTVVRDVVAGRVPGRRSGPLSRVADEVLERWAASGTAPP